MNMQVRFTALSFLLAAFVFAGCGGDGENGASSSTYTITFNAQGGSAVAEQTVNPGEKAAEPAAPTKTYFTFAGWYKEAACVNAWDFNTETVSGDVTLFAKWNDQYALRDTGPAGGLIFYLNPSYATDGWRYLEAAPGDQSTGVQWYNGSYVLIDAWRTGGGDAIGTGQANTTAIVTVQGAGTYAAKICDDLVIGDYSDWFLPSQDELDQMYANLHAAPYGVGGFTANSFYWSSTEYDLINAGEHYFLSSSGGLLDKAAGIARVRAVRSF